MVIKPGEQLNLYEDQKKETPKNADYLKSDDFRAMAQNEADSRKRFGGVFTSGLIADLIVEQNSKSERKISPDDPSEWERIVKRLIELGFHINDKEVNSYIEGLRKDKTKKILKIIKKAKEEKVWGAEAGLPTGDRD